MNYAPGLRERRRIETRQQIHSAVVDLSRELGYGNVTVEAISSRAGVSPRTFFNYFPSKDAAAIGDPPLELRGEFAARFEQGPVSEPYDVLIELTGTLLEQLESLPFDRDAIEVMFAIAAENPEILAALVARMDAVRSDLAVLVAARLADSTDPQVGELIASMAMAAVRSGLEAWARSAGHDSDDSPVPFVSKAFDIMVSLAGNRATR